MGRISGTSGMMPAMSEQGRAGSFRHEGRRLAYTEYGDGSRVVVLLHGLLLSQRMHEPLARALAERGNRVITLDLLGHGRSERPLEPACYSMSFFGQQTIALLDHLEIEEAVVLGTSLGANTALEAAAFAPERLRGMVIEMPVLDSALLACALAFTPLMVALSGAVASKLVTTVMNKGKGLGSTKAKDHVVICGWSGKGAEIIRELRARAVERPRPIVVLANLENDPTKIDEVEFFRGDPSDEADLLRAGIDRCAIAIVLADESTPAATDAERDARTLFTVLAVETVNADAYSCVEVIRSDNRRHFANTHANELVISGEVTGALLAGSAANPGLSRVVTNLVTHPDDQEFYDDDASTWPRHAGRELHAGHVEHRRDDRAVAAERRVLDVRYDRRVRRLPRRRRRR